MTTSYPSKPVAYIDAPEVQNFNAHFVYNFFVPDERVNELGTVPEGIRTRRKDSFSSDFIKNGLDVVPRYVRFGWKKIVLEDTGVPQTDSSINGNNLQNGNVPNKNNQTANFLEANAGKIYEEEEFSNFGFTGIEFQDTAIDEKMYLLASGTLSKVVNSNNLKVAEAFRQNVELLAENIDLNQISLTDASKFLAGELAASSIPSQTLVNILTDLKNAGARFFSISETQSLIDELFGRIKNVKTRTRINNSVLETALQTSVNDPLGLFSDEIAPLAQAASKIQAKSATISNPSTIQEAEFDIAVDPFKIRELPKNSVFFPNKKHIGYIIEKYEQNSNGSLIKKGRIFLNNPSTTSTIDFQVAYGVSYVYEIKAVYLLEFPTYSEDDDEIVISSILFASDASSRQFVECIETTPPPPPADVNVNWDFTERAPVISWQFPVNSQRDIKKFQVFRRKTINDPFELLIEYDFDDSVIRTQNYERVNPNLVKRLTSANNFYIDKEFKKDQKYIYTVCSIDAHGFTSNYGMQFEVQFDRFANRLKKKLISSSGAPKPYPNMYLNEDTFVDTIRDSGHTKVKIYFDPEYLSIIGDSNVELNYLATKQKSSRYKLQFINIDFQQSQELDIMLDDRT